RITGILHSFSSCACCTAILPADSIFFPRCHTKVNVRRKKSLQWTLELLFTEIHLYLPANIIPIMNTDLMGSKKPSTNIAGVILGWSEG
ncbi:paraquat-inducible protein A, partial [Salmonella enterica subsp. enterica serovar Infantis]